MRKFRSADNGTKMDLNELIPEKPEIPQTTKAKWNSELLLEKLNNCTRRPVL